MSIDEVTALHRLLYGRATKGLAVLTGVSSGTAVHPVTAEAAWVAAATQADADGRRVRVRPFACGPVPPGADAHSVLPWQSVVLIRWSRLPSRQAVRSLVAAGGHLMTVAGRDHRGVIALAQGQPLGALVALSREVASVLGAERDAHWYLPVPGLGDTRWLTDYFAPDLALGVDSDCLAAAGLRPSTRPWSLTDART